MHLAKSRANPLVRHLRYGATTYARRETQTDWSCRCAYIRNRTARADPAPPGLACASSPINCVGLSSKLNHRTPGIVHFGIKVEHILHTGDMEATAPTSRIHHILRSQRLQVKSSARRRRIVSRAAALHAPSAGPSDRSADRASSAYGLRAGSSKPSPPPVAPSPLPDSLRAALRDALLRSVRGQGCLPRSAVWSGKLWTRQSEILSAITLLADPRVGGQ